MKLALEFAALVIFALCLSRALNDFLHLRQISLRQSEEGETRKQVMDRPKKLGRTA